MNMNKKTTWTPGPWKIDTDTQGYVVLVAGQRTVCLVGPEEDPTSENDARLIALAPEMAEVIKSVVLWDMCKDIGHKKPLPLFPHIVEQARALLSRLEGGQ